MTRSPLRLLQTRISVETSKCRGHGSPAGQARAVPWAQHILQPGGEMCCCHRAHKQQHRSKVCMSLFYKTFSLAQGQTKAPTPPVSVRDFPTASYCSYTSGSLCLIQVSRQSQKTSTFTGYFTWLKDEFFRKHLCEWKWESNLKIC